MKNNHYDFGTIRKKDNPELTIKLKIENRGNSPLIISKVEASCGCLSAEYSKKPIMPGRNELMYVKINTTNQEGIFNKTLILTSNIVEEYSLLRIQGKIK